MTLHGGLRLGREGLVDALLAVYFTSYATFRI